MHLNEKLSTEFLLITFHYIDYQLFILKMLICFQRVKHSEIMLYEVYK